MRVSRTYHAVLDTGVLASSPSLAELKRFADQNARSQFVVFYERPVQPSVWRPLGGIRTVPRSRLR